METPNLTIALEEFGERIVDEMQNQLFENKSSNTGDLARSITSTIIPYPNGEGETLQVSLLWYGELLEDGGPARKAGGMPPIRPIEGWIRRKKIPVPAKFKSPKSFAFAIAKNIANNKHFDKGPNKYPKKEFIMESINNAATNFGTEEITDAVLTDIKDSINFTVSKNGGKVS